MYDSKDWKTQIANAEKAKPRLDQLFKEASEARVCLMECDISYSFHSIKRITYRATWPGNEYPINTDVAPGFGSFWFEEIPRKIRALRIVRRFGDDPLATPLSEYGKNIRAAMLKRKAGRVKMLRQAGGGPAWIRRSY